MMKNRMLPAILPLLLPACLLCPLRCPAAEEEQASLEELYRRAAASSETLRLIEQAEGGGPESPAALFLPALSISSSEIHSVAREGEDLHGSDILFTLSQPLFPGPSLAARRIGARAEELLMRLRREEAEDRLLLELAGALCGMETLRFRKSCAAQFYREASLIRAAVESSLAIGQSTRGDLSAARLAEERRAIELEFLAEEEKKAARAWSALTGSSPPVTGFSGPAESGGAARGMLVQDIAARDREASLLRLQAEERRRSRAFGLAGWAPEVTISVFGRFRAGEASRGETGWTITARFSGPGTELTASAGYSSSEYLLHRQEGTLVLKTGEVRFRGYDDTETLLRLRVEEIERETEREVALAERAEREIILLEKELTLRAEEYRLRRLELDNGLLSLREYENAAGALAASAAALAEGICSRYLREASLLIGAGRREEFFSRGVPAMPPALPGREP